MALLAGSVGNLHHENGRQPFLQAGPHCTAIFVCIINCCSVAALFGLDKNAKAPVSPVFYMTKQAVAEKYDGNCKEEFSETW